MKPIVLFLGGALISAALFYSGWHCGQSPWSSDQAMIQPTVDRRIQDLSTAANLLYTLDTGSTNALRERLQSQMFLALLDVDSLSDMSDADSRARARCLAKEIAKHRAQGSPSFAGNLNNWPDDSIAQFDAALKQTATAPAK